MAALASPSSTRMCTCAARSNLAGQGLGLQPRHLRLLPAAAGPGLRLASRSASVRATRGSVGVRAETQYLTTAEEAKSLIDQGYTVLDVRDPTQYVRSHVSGSVHVPFFIVNEDQDLQTAILRQAHRQFVGILYGLAFTKPNPTFYEDVKAKFPQKDTKILVLCQEGLRSNSVVDELEDLGYTNLATLSRGINRIPPGVIPKEGPRELMDAGKGGFVAIQTQFSIVLATILISCIIFLEYFPDQATELLKSLPQPPAP